MPSEKLTQKFVDQITHSTTGNKTNYFDTELTGFALEVRAQGKSYFIFYRDQRAVKRQRTIGNPSIIKLSDARTLAQKLLSQIALGQDPFARKAELKKVPLVRNFIEQSYLPYIKTYKRSWNTDVSLIKNHIMPHFGSKYMDEITKHDVITFVTKHRSTHAAGSTNRIIILLRYMYNLAIRWEVAGIVKNVTSGIDLLEDNNKRERYLSEEEVARLYEAIRGSENPMLQYIVPALLLTGARKREVLDAQWSEFDFDKRQWRVTKTKLGKPRYIPISDGLKALLDSVPKVEGCDYVFANPKTGKPYVQIFCSWNTARAKAGLPEVRIHDLRHSFASFLVNGRRSLYEVQKLLGHTQIKTTQRYAHLSHDTLLDASNVVGRLIPLPVPANDDSAEQVMMQ
jgi:integrase